MWHYVLKEKLMKHYFFLHCDFILQGDLENSDFTHFSFMESVIYWSN